MSSDAAAVQFTGNLKVIAKDAWDAENVPPGRVPTRPSTATSWGVGWEQRMGEVIPDSGGDRWWSVRPGDDLAAIAREVTGSLEAYGLPAIEKQLASAAEQPRHCWHDVGGRNWFEPCRRLADTEVRSGDRVLLRCAEHAHAYRDAPAVLLTSSDGASVELRQTRYQYPTAPGEPGDWDAS